MNKRAIKVTQKSQFFEAYVATKVGKETVVMNRMSRGRSLTAPLELLIRLKTSSVSSAGGFTASVSSIK